VRGSVRSAAGSATPRAKTGTANKAASTVSTRRLSSKRFDVAIQSLSDGHAS
jgi:hypothetical protein